MLPAVKLRGTQGSDGAVHDFGDHLPFELVLVAPAVVHVPATFQPEACEIARSIP